MSKITMFTQTLYLREWYKKDKERLFELASDPDVGPMCGWKPLESVEDADKVLNTILCKRETYAILLRHPESEQAGLDEIIGCITVKRKGESEICTINGEAEIGCWLGKEFWGKGYMKQAVDLILDRCFNSLSCTEIWWRCREDNLRSACLAIKCGFKFSHLHENLEYKELEETHNANYYHMDEDDYIAITGLKTIRHFRALGCAIGAAVGVAVGMETSMPIPMVILGFALGHAFSTMLFDYKQRKLRIAAGLIPDVVRGSHGEQGIVPKAIEKWKQKNGR